MSPGPAPLDPLPSSVLARDHGIDVSVLRPHAGGFESDCWVADETWFVKVWRRQEPAAGLDLLHQLAAAGLPVPAPLRNVAGELSATWRGRPYAVFPYVRGRPADSADWRQTARALKRVHEVQHVDLPQGTMAQPEIERLREWIDHPWIADRRDEVLAGVARLERAVERAAPSEAVPTVVCHRDFGGANLILDDDGGVAAIVDWEQAVLGPREHDVWIAAEDEHCEAFLTEYGARDLDLDHVEYALLTRGLGDLAARLVQGVDRPGVDTWGLRRLAKLDHDLALFRPFCA